MFLVSDKSEGVSGFWFWKKEREEEERYWDSFFLSFISTSETSSGAPPRAKVDERGASTSGFSGERDRPGEASQAIWTWRCEDSLLVSFGES